MLRPRVINLVGPGGAGKSTVGHALARRQGVAFIDHDEEFTARAGEITHRERFEPYEQRPATNVATVGPIEAVVDRLLVHLRRTTPSPLP